MKPTQASHGEKSSLGPGTMVENFKLIRTLGRGGMGEVYLAQDTQLGRNVALKLIHPSQLDDTARSRLLFEARATAKFNHPNIITIYDVGEFEGRPFLALEYLEGESLRERLQQKEVPLEDALRVVLAVLRGLQEAHKHDLLHRDLKPENIFLPKDGRVRVLDFGLASQTRLQKSLRAMEEPLNEEEIRALDPLEEAWSAIGESDRGVRGTPLYMAPEQWRNHTLTPAADVWAVGVILYELLEGRRPYPIVEKMSVSSAFLPTFDGDISDDSLAELATEELPAEALTGGPGVEMNIMELALQVTDTQKAPALTPSEEYPEGLTHWIGRCLDKDPQQRPTTDALIEFLERQLLGTSFEDEMGILSDSLASEQFAPGEAPYRGLQAFGLQHARFFFGREQLVSQLLGRLKQSLEEGTGVRFLGVLGPSGSGKSSLVHAGLLAALADGTLEGSQRWPLVRLRPGSDPLESLAQAMATPGESVSVDDTRRRKALLQEDPLALHKETEAALAQAPEGTFRVVVVDQFEEVFTLTRQEDEAQTEAVKRAFLANLVAAAREEGGRTLVILTMRADFYGKCAPYRDFAMLLSNHQVLVGPMEAKELRRAIVEPAIRAGVRFEPGLVELLLNEVEEQAGALPLLQHALLELWQLRKLRRLTKQAYETIGGVRGALEKRAEQLYQALPEEDQEICQRVFLRLTQAGEGTEDTKRKVLIDDLLPARGDKERTEALLRKLSAEDARLLTIEGVGWAEKSDKEPDGTDTKGGGEETREETTRTEVWVEVSHEALIRGWRRLRAWLDRDREALRIHDRLSTAAKEWEQHQQEESYLFAGTRLKVTEEWLREHRDAASALEWSFLRESKRKRRREQAMMYGAVIFVALLLIAGIVTFFLLAKEARSAQEEARRERERASQETLAKRGVLKELKQAEVEIQKATRVMKRSQQQANLALRKQKKQHQELLSRQRRILKERSQMAATLQLYSKNAHSLVEFFMGVLLDRSNPTPHRSLAAKGLQALLQKSRHVRTNASFLHKVPQLLSLLRKPPQGLPGEQTLRRRLALLAVTLARRIRPERTKVQQALRQNKALLGRWRRCLQSTQAWVPTYALHLQPLLKDRDPVVRQRLAVALATATTAECLVSPGLLHAALHDRVSQVRRRALRVLGRRARTGHPTRRTLPTILKLLQGTNARDQRVAMQVLVHMGRQDSKIVGHLVQSFVQGPLPLRRKLAVVLGQIGTRARSAIPVLRRACTSKDRLLRRALLQALGNFGTLAAPAVPVLVRALLSKDRKTRQGAAVALGKIGAAADDALPALVRCLSDRNWGVKHAATKALGQIASSSASVTAALWKQLGTHKADTRRRLMKALTQGEQHLQGMEATLHSALRSKAPQMRADAATLLALIPPHKGTRQSMLAAMADQAPKVRQAVAKTLGSWGRKQPKVVEALRARLHAKDKHTATVALQALIQVGKNARTAVHALQKSLAAGSPKERRLAAKALGQIGPDHPSIITALTQALAHKDPTLKRECLHALGQMGKAARPAVAAMTKALNAPQSRVQRAAIEALGNLGAVARTAVTGLRRMLSGHGSFLRDRAAQALGKIGKQDPSVVNDLTRLLTEQDGNVKRAAIYALGMIGPAAKPAVNTLTHMVRNEERYTRRAAIYALGRIGPAAKPAVKTLMRVLSARDWSIRRAAVSALGKIASGQEAIDVFLRALSDRDRYVRRYAARALARVLTHTPRRSLTQGLDFPYYQVRATAETQLHRPGLVPSLSPHLLQTRQQPLLGGRTADTLGHTCDADAVKPLLHALQYAKDWSIRIRSALALAQLGPLALPTLPSLQILHAKEPSPAVKDALHIAQQCITQQPSCKLLPQQLRHCLHTAKSLRQSPPSHLSPQQAQHKALQALQQARKTCKRCTTCTPQCQQL